MEKINFINGETPINDTNLNQMQDNMENAISTMKETIVPEIKLHNDGDGDILVAEINFTVPYQREGLVFSAIEIGSTSNNDTGIVLIGLSSNGNNEVLQDSNAITTLGNVQVYTVIEGTNVKVYAKKTGYYRRLYIQLINKTDNVIWHG